METKKNPKVIALSLTALLFMYFTYKIHWMFIIGAVILSGISWKILTKKK